MMGQVGADDDDRSVAIPKCVENVGHGILVGLAHQKGDDCERLQHELEKRELNLDGMIAVAGGVVEMNLGVIQGGQNARTINRHLSQRGQKSVGRRRGQTLDTRAVTCSQQDDLLDRLGPGEEPGIAGRGDRSGVDITGMGDDQALRLAPSRRRGIGKQTLNLLAKRLRVSRIEAAGDGWQTHLHGGPSSPRR